MAKRVGINGEVLEWAMKEASVSTALLADRTAVSPEDVSQWMVGAAQPTRGQFKKIVETLHRPSSIFFLPDPPKTQGVPPELRRASGRNDRALLPEEARLVRRARRLQRLLVWVLNRSGDARPPDYSTIPTTRPPGEAGQYIRDWLGISVAEQSNWSTAKEAFDAWRARLEDLNVVVLQLQLGKRGLRGFALPDTIAPIIAVNTADNYQARTFTLFHEVSHLISNTATACLELADNSEGFDLERWCEQTASAALVPAASLRQVVSQISIEGTFQTEIELISGVAQRFGISLRAAAVAMIQQGLTDREVYSEIEDRFPASDREKGFARGTGQRAPQRRLGELGRRATTIVLDAMDDDLVTERDARDYLRLGGEEISELASQVRPA